MTPEEQFRMMRSDDVWPVDVRVETVAGSRGVSAWPIVWRTVAGVAAIALVAGAVYGVMALRDARSARTAGPVPTGTASSTAPTNVPTSVAVSPAVACDPADLRLEWARDTGRGGYALTATIFTEGDACNLSLDDVRIRDADGVDLTARTARPSQPLVRVDYAGAWVRFQWSSCTDPTQDPPYRDTPALQIDDRSWSLTMQNYLPVAVAACGASLVEQRVVSARVVGLRGGGGGRIGESHLGGVLHLIESKLDELMPGEVLSVALDTDHRGGTISIGELPSAAVLAQLDALRKGTDMSVRFRQSAITRGCLDAMSATFNPSKHGIHGTLSYGPDDSGTVLEASASDEPDPGAVDAWQHALTAACPGAALDFSVDAGLTITPSSMDGVQSGVGILVPSATPTP